MMVWLLFIIDLMGLFFYNKIGSIISIGDLPTTNIIEPIYLQCFSDQNLCFDGNLTQLTPVNLALIDVKEKWCHTE